MQKFVPIFQETILAKQLECFELRDSAAGLEIFFRDQDENVLVIRFQEHLTYRLMDEGDALESVRELWMSDCKNGRFYKVECSEFLEWFHVQSQSIRRGDPLIHYAVFAANDVIDIIALDTPYVGWRTESP